MQTIHSLCVSVLQLRELFPLGKEEECTCPVGLSRDLPSHGQPLRSQPPLPRTSQAARWPVLPVLAPPWLAFSALSHWTISSLSFKAQPPSYVPSSVKPSGCPTPAGSGCLSADPSVIDICCAQGQCLPKTSWQSKA